MDSSNISDFAAASIFSGFALFFFLLWLLPGIFFALSLQKALSRVASERRTMNPPMVWLLLIPLFNAIWTFIVVLALSKSLDAELTARNIPHEPEPAKTFGLVWAGLWAACHVPGLNVLLCIPAFIMWIIYWVKISDFSGKIADPSFTKPA